MAIEHKTGKALLSSRIHEALDQAVRGGVRTGRIPAVTIEDKGRAGRRSRICVVMEFEHFTRLVEEYAQDISVEEQANQAWPRQ